MKILSTLRRLLNSFHNHRDLDAELDSHLQLHIDDNLRSGMSPEEARRQALLKLGGLQQTKLLLRDQHTLPIAESFLRDLRHAARLLLRKPTFTLVAILTLALGIGANATIFAMVSRFVLHSAPVGDPATLLSLHTTERNECCNSFTWPLFTDVRDNAHSFSGVTAFVELLPASISGNGDPQRLWGQATTTNFFDVTQLPLTLGRGFRSDEQNSPVIVLGNRVWNSRFNSDPNIAGKSITLSGRLYTVIGVAPPNFRGLDLILDAQFWVPIGNIDQLLPNTSHFDSRVYHWIVVAARLKPGATQSEASAELNLLAQRFAAAHPDTDKNLGFRFEQAGSLPPRDKSVFLLFLSTLMLVVFLVLLIACANVANLFLAQAAGRQHEMAVRIALGATRAQLLRQVLTESILLSLVGGLLGILISVFPLLSLLISTSASTPTFSFSLFFSVSSPARCSGFYLPGPPPGVSPPPPSKAKTSSRVPAASGPFATSSSSRKSPCRSCFSASPDSASAACAPPPTLISAFVQAAFSPCPSIPACTVTLPNASCSFSPNSSAASPSFPV